MEEDRIVMMSTKGYQNLVEAKDGKNLYWTSDIDTELPIKIKTSGFGSEAPTTLAQMFRKTAIK
jgi:hypothetical protein